MTAAPSPTACSKVVLVLLDGLGFDTAVRELGYLEGLVEAGRAARACVRSVLPSLSRPTYATVLTGLVPAAHGITGNGVARRLTVPHLFSLASEAGRSTAAVAYFWIHELVMGPPFDPVRDGEGDQLPGPLHHGRFYQAEDFPDQEAITQAARLIARHAPDFVLLHPMGCDHQGHQGGGGSLAYRRAAARQGELLSQVIPGWLEAGYRVVVTADHGMNADAYHGGPSDDERLVPLYLIHAGLAGVIAPVIEQTAVAPTVLRLLGLPLPSSLPTAPLV
ncbi:alkaline phosphatase family protein [Pararhodospirillum oryzae]|uniref:Nucleotide pyrophosphatase n=1 Tax=Pararhodospirillum oryzae TaxID=478448 RepID=A0A512H598_9PROT|nr:alkaline phosphatase family protein [Pararhodospirillum oryzae]GEO80608.1 hypothetical protein ROR02_07390 [Pararhodospirillum oryzae]